MLTIRKLAACLPGVLCFAVGCGRTSTGLDSLAASSANNPHLTHPAGTVFAIEPLYGEPYGLAIDGRGDLLVARVLADIVTRFELPNSVPQAGIDFARRRAIIDSTGDTTYAVRATGPVHVAINPAGTTAYVAEQFGNAVGVVSLQYNVVTRHIDLSNPAFNIAVAPNGGRVYASTADGRLYVIDAATNAVVDSMQIGPVANGFAFSPDGTVLYASSRDAGTVTAFRTSDDALVQTFTVGGAPQRLAMAPDGKTLYVANEASGLNVINLRRGRIEPSVNPLGRGYGLGITPDGEQLYLTDARSGRVAIIETKKLQTVQILDFVDGEPRNVAFDATGAIAVVTDGTGRVWFFN